jgi:hypothetical protein
MTRESKNRICAAIYYYRDQELRHSVVLDALNLDIGVRRDGISER